MSLSFTQRLTRANNDNWQKASNKRQSIKKVQTPEKGNPTNHWDFKKNHSDLKNMLKQLQGPKNPQIKRPTSQMKEENKMISVKSTQITVKKQCTKQNVGNKISFSKSKRSPEKILKIKNTPFLFEPEQDIQGKFVKTLRSEKKIKQGEVIKPKFVKKQNISKKGIPNIGNTCYINAIIQCLFHLPEFNEFFVKSRYEDELNPYNKGVVSKYKSLFDSVMSKNKNTEISTLPLKKSVSKICSLFIDFQQEDAHEFLRQLLDSMHQDLNLITEKSPWKLLETNGKDRNIYSLALQYWNYYKAIDDSYIYDSFCGQVCNSVTCASCHHESISFDNFLDLSLPMVKGKNKLQQLLKAYFESQTLCDYYSCSVCHKSIKNSSKKSQLWRAPKHLIIHLKRSQFGRKNNEKIQIPVRCLNMKQFMKYSNDKSAKLASYSLQGVVLHRGVIDGGHYWAQVKQGANWFIVDDENVGQQKDISNSYELQGSEYAYILFYRSLSI